METSVSVITRYKTGSASRGPCWSYSEESTMPLRRAQMAASGHQREIVK